MTGTSAVWLYAVVPAGRLPEVGGLAGVAGEPVRLVSGERLAAVVGSVPLTDFAEAPLRDHLEDLRWLEETARSHHAVIAALFRGGDAVPVRFATIYHDDDAVRAVLADRGADFAAALDHIAGRTEWGVKAYVDPDALLTPPADGPGEEHSPGTAYLLRRRAQRRSREDAHREAMRRAEEIRTALSAVAMRSAQHPPQDPRLADYQGWMILNDSFLVDETRTGDFTAAVASCEQGRPEVRLELSGPWPPYSFTGDGRQQDDRLADVPPPDVPPPDVPPPDAPPPGRRPEGGQA